jgi:hypothetical protein
MSELADVDDALRKTGRPVREVSEWGKAFLKGVRASGNISRSARKARVSPTTVRKYAKAHPEFARRISAALVEYGDALEENLGVLAFKGNAIANISRLKALNQRLAAKYSEKAVDARVLNLTINQGNGAPPDTAAIMAHLRGSMSADELRAMDGEIVEADVLALPEVAGASAREAGGAVTPNEVRARRAERLRALQAVTMDAMGLLAQWRDTAQRTTLERMWRAPAAAEQRHPERPRDEETP